VPARIVETNLYEIPSGLDYDEAAMLEPLACVVLGNEAAGIAPGDTVVVAGGGGPIGLMHLQLARHNGASQVVVIDLLDSRLQLAERLGATHVVNPGREDPVPFVQELTQGRGADVVIETSGVAEVWEMSVLLARKGGTVVMFGGCPGGSQVAIDASRVHYGELTIKGVFHHTPKTVARALQLLSDRVIEAGPLISGRVPLQETQAALEKMMSGEAIKMAIIP
jgi:L-iditol 2-dehydrogenase